MLRKNGAGNKEGAGFLLPAAVHSAENKEGAECLLPPPVHWHQTFIRPRARHFANGRAILGRASLSTLMCRTQAIRATLKLTLSRHQAVGTPQFLQKPQPLSGLRPPSTSGILLLRPTSFPPPVCSFLSSIPVGGKVVGRNSKILSVGTKTGRESGWGFCTKTPQKRHRQVGITKRLSTLMWRG